MTRLIFIDNNSGYIYGDSADINGKVFSGTEVEFARALDESIGVYGRDYILTSNPRDTSTGYHVYATTDVFPTVGDGQDSDTIEAVERDCKYVGYIVVLYQDC